MLISQQLGMLRDDRIYRLIFCKRDARRLLRKEKTSGDNKQDARDTVNDFRLHNLIKVYDDL